MCAGDPLAKDQVKEDFKNMEISIGSTPPLRKRDPGCY